MKSLKILVIGLVAAGNALADVTLKDVSQTLTVGGGVLTKIIWAACIVVGIMLIAAAFTQFQIHRRNPKLVPLTTPVMYLILGIAAIAIPFIDRVNDFLKGAPPGTTHVLPTSGLGNKTKPASPPAQYDPNDIDSPMN